jgi:hypothetical protein
VGQVIIAGWHPHEAAILDTIRQHGLEHQIIMNKGAVMVLPPGVNKASGLEIAVHELCHSLMDVVCIGDAENDQAMFAVCGCSVAVANALVPVKYSADVVTERDHGAGVIEVIDELLATDLSARWPTLTRHDIFVGWDTGEHPVFVHPGPTTILVAGAPASGKSTFIAGLLDRLHAERCQVCVVDPEGDYRHAPGFVHLGGSDDPPTISEVIRVLQRPELNAIVDLLGVPMGERPGLFADLSERLMTMHAEMNRPHWLVIDEAHHLLPLGLDVEPSVLTPLREAFDGVVIVTVEPGHLPAHISASADLALAFGATAELTLDSIASVGGRPAPTSPRQIPDIGEALAWYSRQGDGVPSEPFLLRTIADGIAHRRHERKYVEGDMGEERSFYFRGPDNQLNLPARNLQAFIDLAANIDDAVWTWHLRRGDYSRWVRGTIGDTSLSSALSGIETRSNLTADESRARVRAAIEARYAPPV